MRTTATGRVTALCAALLASTGSCTLVKPVVCTFTYPIDNIRARLAAPDDDDRHADLPPLLAVLAAPVIVPMRFVSEAAIGAVGGVFSGFASDLNVITGRFDKATRNLTRPFKTNAEQPQ